LFWSKIWLFFVALAAAVALTIALALPRAAHKSRVQDERQRLVVACDVVNILLEGKARTDVDVVAQFSRDAGLVTALSKVKENQDIKPNESPSKDVLEVATGLMSKIEGDKPGLAVLTDARGRVVARSGVDEGVIGDVLAGRFLIDDALAGYLRDDVWVELGSVFLVAASPVVSRSTSGDQIIGVAVLGWKLDSNLADGFVAPFRDSDKDAEDRSTQVAFYANGKQVTRSSTPAMLDTDLIAQFGKVKLPESVAADCKQIAPFYAHDATGEYAVVMSRVPGEAEHDGAFFAVFTPRPAEASFAGAVGKAKGELGGSFPWVIVGAMFVLGLGGGIALMLVEHDRPLRRLQADAVRLAKAERERLAEEDHGGRFGSIARSVNIQIDKLTRDAKAAKKDLDQLLGPAPEGSLGALDLLGGTPLPARPAGPSLMTPPAASAAPPPSEFRFSDAGSGPTGSRRAPGAPELDLSGPKPAGAAAPPPRPAAPPPPAPPRPPVPAVSARSPAPPPRPVVTPAGTPAPDKVALDDDILALGDVPTTPGSNVAEEAYFHEVFEQFVELKRKCGESTTGLTYAKFGEKLRKNRDELISKTGCTEVKFTVYVKDGKAALKATPVKD